MTANPAMEKDDVLATAADWREAGKGVALATVVSTWGSSPRPIGSQLVVDEDSRFVGSVSGGCIEGNFIGSVSGGCIEGAVVLEALEVIKSGAPRLLDFGVTDEQAWEVGLACGGKVEVFVEKLE